MKTRRSAASLLGLAMLLCTASSVFAQSQPEVRRARPETNRPLRALSQRMNQSTEFSAL